jgi:hypothetical protein
LDLLSRWGSSEYVHIFLSTWNVMEWGRGAGIISSSVTVWTSSNPK